MPDHIHEDDGTVEGCPGCFSEPSRELVRWADVAMYESAVNPLAAAGKLVRPQVTVVNMTRKPLQTLAAAALLYDGIIETDPANVSKDDTLRWWADMSRTVLAAPLEFIDVHLFVEGVPRDFTHQMVRQRTAVYVQESQRFAVKRNARFEESVPPFIANLPDDHPLRVIWNRAAATDAWAYNALIDGGAPAEVARKRLPHAITTRLHYKSNLRNLVVEAGKRTCSQAQYDWKEFWTEAIKAIMSYGPDEDRWQQLAIVRMFRPVCFRTGKCEFMAAADRYCRIRDRVEKHHRKGELPETWTDINPNEALLEDAARLAPGEVL